MFVYLSKRIAIPNGVTITSIGWNEEQGWLATGGAGGLLKVLKVDGGQQGRKSGGLSLNQTLEGHEHAVTHVAWNHRCRRLTSSDTSGRIIVWTLHKGMWFEEMVNNRQASHVVDLMWSADGSRVCIAYADGAVIVGNIDGNRLWGQNFDYALARVCWSPNDRYLLFGTVTGEVYVHDAGAGQLVSQIKVASDESSSSSSAASSSPDDAHHHHHHAEEDKEEAGGSSSSPRRTRERLVGLLWHPAWVDRPEPLSTLAICFDSGRLQLMNRIGDENPYLVETGIRVQYIAWNPQGTVIALTGKSADAATDNSMIITQFYSNEAVHLRSLRVTGKECGGVTWESDGLRIAIAVDSSVYFANIRPSYRYCFFEKTLVYTHHRPDKVEDSVTFWNVKTNERITKQVRGLLFLDACMDVCAMVSKPSRTRQQCMVQLLRAIGSPMETKFIAFEPFVCAMNSSHVVCGGEENIYLWQFRDPSLVVDALDPVSVQVSRSESHERVFHIEDVVHPDRDDRTALRSAVTNDYLCAVCMSEQYLVVGRESGLVNVYRLVPLQLTAKLILLSRPQSMAINRDSTCVSVIDLSGHMRVYALDTTTHTSLIPRKAEAAAAVVERKDVWDMRWASDDAGRLAVMEKTRMTLFCDGVAEEPVQSNANLCAFAGLTVQAVQLDELAADPDRPRKESLVTFETRELREMRARMRAAETVKEVYDYVEETRANMAATLWPLLAEFALSRLDFTYAEMAFIHSRNYPAIQFVKRVRALDDAHKQLAEVEAYYGHFDEAEKIYKDMDRKDLALDLRRRLGDWFGVVRLVQEGGGDESLMYRAWESIGDHYAERQKWNKAIQYYTQCKQYDKLAYVFYVTEDFDMLAQLLLLAEHRVPLLHRLAEMFLSVGRTEEAARAFVAAGQPRRAVDGCVARNDWDRAMTLAQEHHADDVAPLLARYARHLVEHDRLAEAVELHRRAGQHDAAARLLARLGRRAAAADDPLRAKKFYVLSAMEVGQHRRTRVKLGEGGTAVVEALLRSEDTTDHTTTHVHEGAVHHGSSGGRRHDDINNNNNNNNNTGVVWGAGGEEGRVGGGEGVTEAAWRGAEAYHFYLACQSSIVEKNLHAAFVLAMRLTEYDDLIAPVDSYRLIALTAYLVENYAVCSAAFMRLEAAERNDAAAAAAAGGGGGGSGGGGAARAEMTLSGWSLDLDVTQRGGTSTGSAVGGGHTLEGTTTSLSTSSDEGVSNAGGVAATTYPTVSVDEPEFRFAKLAAQIFTRHPPVDSSVKSVPCSTCGTFNTEWSSRCAQCQQPFSMCIVSGRAIVSDEEAWQCHVCHHRAVEMEMERFKNCPLCHSPKKTRLRQAL